MAAEKLAGRERLAQMVELLEALVADHHLPLAALVVDLDLEAEGVGDVLLQRHRVRVAALSPRARTLGRGLGTSLGLARQLLGLMVFFAERSQRRDRSIRAGGSLLGARLWDSAAPIGRATLQLLPGLRPLAHRAKLWLLPR